MATPAAQPLVELSPPETAGPDETDAADRPQRTRTRHAKTPTEESDHAEPYVRSSEHILQKYRGHAPSLIIHLHATNFRFDQQDGSFSYDSPMRVILQHLKSQTVPHDALEELLSCNVRFYEGCLIVQVKDHRKQQHEADVREQDVHPPFSLHNYEQWITPSPYVPYPERATTPPAEVKAPAKLPIQVDTYTVVLHPTPLSLLEEVFIQANTPDVKSSKGNILTKALLVNTSKPKMSIEGANVAVFESRIVAATAPPLFLEPVESHEQAAEVLQRLQDPLLAHAAPSPKRRKRTIAELAADERLLAQDQSFMLTMDEILGPSVSKTAETAFQPRFEQFSTIQQIKLQHQEQARLLAQRKQQRDHDLKQQEAIQAQQLELRRKDQAEKAAKARLLQQQQQHSPQQQARLQAQREAAARLARQQAAGGVPMNAALSHGSPVMRQDTPQSHASPMMGMMPGGVPMQNSLSSSSPPRPGSALQHGHPGGINMVHQRSRPSRSATPHIGTPMMATAAAPMGIATPNSHMAQVAPSNMMNAQALNQQIMAAQRTNGQVSPEQQQQLLRQRAQQAQFQWQQHQVMQQRQQLQQQPKTTPRPPNGAPQMASPSMTGMSPPQQAMAMQQGRPRQMLTALQNQQSAVFQNQFQAQLMQMAAQKRCAVGQLTQQDKEQARAQAIALTRNMFAKGQAEMNKAAQQRQMMQARAPGTSMGFANPAGNMINGGLTREQMIARMNQGSVDGMGQMHLQ